LKEFSDKSEREVRMRNSLLVPIFIGKQRKKHQIVQQLTQKETILVYSFKKKWKKNIEAD
jgi:hypothetical protein